MCEFLGVGAGVVGYGLAWGEGRCPVCSGGELRELKVEKTRDNGAVEEGEIALSLRSSQLQETHSREVKGSRLKYSLFAFATCQ